MLIIAKEETLELARLEKLLHQLNQPYRVLLTNLETDLEKEKESLATFFTQQDPSSKIGEPLFFNDLEVPEYWEPWTLGITTYIFDGTERRANVIFRKDVLSRTVGRVEWFGQGEEIATIDLYNRYGWRSKQSLLDERGQAYLEIYLNQKQEEVLLHFVSEGTFLHQTAKGRDRVYANKEELLRAVLDHLLPEAKGVLLMDKDLLSFVERIDKERLAYCGNWSLDLAELTEHVGQLMVLDETLLPEKKECLMELSGFVDLEGVSFQPQALIMTASQEVKGLSNLVDQFPQVTFHIAALTTMGPKLTKLAPCSNVRLYPGISMDQYEELLASCSLYLDCNQGKEVLSSSIRALENGQLLLGLQDTVHQEVYKELTTVTETVEEMKVQLGEILAHPESFQERLKEQAHILQLPKKEELRRRFECLEGGSHEHLYL